MQYPRLSLGTIIVGRDVHRQLKLIDAVKLQYQRSDDLRGSKTLGYPIEFAFSHAGRYGSGSSLAQSHGGSMIACWRVNRDQQTYRRVSPNTASTSGIGGRRRYWRSRASASGASPGWVWKLSGKSVEDFPAFITVDDQRQRLLQQSINDRCANCIKVAPLHLARQHAAG